MSVSRNLIAGLSNSAWSALVGLAAVPFYLKFLGVEAYGLIGFYITFQALLQLLDMGMTPTINREVARYSAAGVISGAGKLLHSLAIVSWGVALLIAILVFIMAPLIGSYWLRSAQLTYNTILHSVMLIGFVLACRWPIALYQGVLIGAQRLTVSSAINMVMVTIGSFGAVAVLAYISPTIEAYFIWQALVGLFYLLAIRAAAWHVIGVGAEKYFDLKSIRSVLRFSLGVGAISISGLVLTQLDKLILSKILQLDGFGKYMLATTVASSMYILIVPIFNVAYPRFSALIAQQMFDELLLQYRSASRWLATLLFPAAMFLIILAKTLISLWTGNELLAVDIQPLVSLLFIAYALHGVMYMPYALMLAQGEPRPMLVIYICLIVIMVPMTISLSIFYGAVGGAFAQFSLFVLYLFLGAFVTHKHYLKGLARTWLLQDVGRPLAISVLIGVSGYLAISLSQLGWFAEFLAGLMCWWSATLFCICSSRQSRSVVVEYWGHLRHKQR